MNRRSFIHTVTAAGGAMAMVSQARAEESAANPTTYIELRRYLVESEEQRAALLAFFKDALVPACERLGVGPVGVFIEEETLSPVHVLIPHASLESFATLTHRLHADAAFQEAGADVINAPAEAPAYTRIESSLFAAFEQMPQVERPVSNPDRVFQLRVYESPSVVTGQKKIEMFNLKEIEIFRKTGLAPVFFGEALAGDKLPNLTYMLAFENKDALAANWKTFIADPEWKELSAKEEYADKKILSGITNIVLKPAEGSQL